MVKLFLNLRKNAVKKRQDSTHS